MSAAHIKELRNALLDPVHKCLAEQFEHQHEQQNEQHSGDGGDSDDAADWNTQARADGLVSVEMEMGAVAGKKRPGSSSRSRGDALAAQGLFLVESALQRVTELLEDV
jgi:hypothetical protein